MDLELSEEQTLLREAVGEMLARASGDALWRDLVEFGALDEGLTAVDLALIARGLGGRLASVPLLRPELARRRGGRVRTNSMARRVESMVLQVLVEIVRDEIDDTFERIAGIH